MLNLRHLLLIKQTFNLLITQPVLSINIFLRHLPPISFGWKSFLVVRKKSCMCRSINVVSVVTLPTMVTNINGTKNTRGIVKIFRLHRKYVTICRNVIYIPTKFIGRVLTLFSTYSTYIERDFNSRNCKMG